MTREEAVEVLKERYLTCVGIGLDNHANRVNEAIDMAIEALSAEATTGDCPNDLISRSALMEYCSNQKSKSIDNNDIARFPSAEAVQGWIPVEEQPPVFPCLVCDANGNQPSVPLGIVTITDEEHGEWHIDGRLWDTKIFFKGEWCSQTGYGNRIIAWMPLPEPYKGGDEA